MSHPTNVNKPRVALRTVVLVGLGAIGSFLVSHLARLRGLQHLLLIDMDRYEARNRSCQDIEARDVGRFKAEAQADRARRIAPQVETHARSVGVESVPAGLLRADLVLSATDSLASRRAVADRVVVLGVPWVDAGVHGPEQLVRVTSYLPGEDRACIECGWDERHYVSVDVVHSCLEALEQSGARSAAAATNAGAGVGAMAAALQAVTCQELGDADLVPPGPGRQVILDLANHHAYVSELQRNPRCRRAEHGVWFIEPLAADLAVTTLGDLLRTYADEAGASGGSLRVLGSSFVNGVVCRAGCGRQRSELVLEASLRSRKCSCVACGHPVVPIGFEKVDRLVAAELRTGTLARTLHDLGLRPGEVVSVGGNAADPERHFELVGPSGPCAGAGPHRPGGEREP